MTLESERWQERLTRLAAEHRVVGASLAFRLGQEVGAVAAGVLNVRTGQPATPASLFQVGSITKVWTATLVMQLADEGLLELDTPVREYLPEFRVADPVLTEGVTPRHLLAHTSGIDGDLFLDTGRGDDCLARYVAAMSDLRANHPLGATMSYCNAGYIVLGRLVEVLRGRVWDDVLREQLLRPLGLHSAGTLPEEALLHGAAVGHHLLPDTDKQLVTPEWGLFRSCGPAGLVHSTASDQLALTELHRAGGVTSDGARLLSAVSVDAMQEPQVGIPDPYSMGSHWGLGWILSRWDGRRVIGHDGATLGQAAFLWLVPDSDVSVSLCTTGGNAADLFEALAGELLGELAGIVMPSRPVPPDKQLDVDPARYVGRYAREGAELVVSPSDDGLQLSVRTTGPLANSRPAMPPRQLRALSEEILLSRAPGERSWTPVAFFDLDGERYLHFGARATRRVSPQV
ncbi:MAG: hypothetical protein QOE45_1514 [Frankiaceae bacterium]|jgi:CubicO group peptidase (beta-lactamase class C family)|nr:hypothetical protein [Frankiaceae bacterium]